MGTLFTIIGVLFNVWTLVLIAVLLAAAAAIYFLPPPVWGPAKLLKIVLNPATWLGIAGALILIYMTHATKVIEQQKQEIHQQAVVQTSTDDGAAVLTDNTTKKTAATQKSTRLQHAIDTAKPGDEEDEVLDQIAREQHSSVPATH